MRLKLHNLHISRSTVVQLRIFKNASINKHIIHSEYATDLVDHKLSDERVNFSFFSLYKSSTFKKLI